MDESRAFIIDWTTHGPRFVDFRRPIDTSYTARELTSFLRTTPI